MFALFVNRRDGTPLTLQKGIKIDELTGSFWSLFGDFFYFINYLPIEMRNTSLELPIKKIEIHLSIPDNIKLLKLNLLLII